VNEVPVFQAVNVGQFGQWR